MTMLNGKIIKGVGGIYTVTDGTQTVNCKARGLFRKEKLIPCVGDNVVTDETGFITEILSRKNILIRPPVANIDYLGIVLSAGLPQADTFMLDKLTVTAFSMGIVPFVIINKCDVADKDSVSMLRAHLFATGLDVIETNCTSPDGIRSLTDYLKEGVTSFAGQSGVGKSSLLQMLLPEKNIEIGELSEKLERGKHTTRHVELCEVAPGKYVMDTPGFSKYDTEVPDVEALCACYPEFRKYQKQCAFNSCTHTHEPNCAIKEAVNNSEISKTRYKNYIKIKEEILSRKVNYK